MRDILVFLAIIASLPFCFRRPFFGLIVFTALAYLRPQDLCWGFARTMRFSLYVGVTMFAGYFANEVGRRPFFRRDLRTSCMLVLLVMTIISTLPAEVLDEYVIAGLFEFTVIISVAIFTTGQLDSKQRIRLLLWTMALGLGFYGVKGGVFGLLGGKSINQGPGGMMKDNNDFALALVMGIPMLFYLGATEKNALVRKAAWLCAGLTCVTVVLTHSRGGFLAMVLAWLVIAFRSGKLFRVMLAGSVVTVLFLQLAPDSVLDRYSTIEQAAEGEGDSSVQARLRAWKIGMRMVEENPILGVGHKNFRLHYGRHAEVLFPGENLFNHVAHNSYVQIWAENGTPAFFVFLLILASTFPAMARVRRLARQREDLAWAVSYANLVEASLAAFVLGAFFLNRGHFDLSYHVVGIGSALLFFVRAELAAPAGELAHGELTHGETAAAVAMPVPPRGVWGRAGTVSGELPRWGRTT